MTNTVSIRADLEPGAALAMTVALLFMLDTACYCDKVLFTSTWGRARAPALIDRRFFFFSLTRQVCADRTENARKKRRDVVKRLTSCIDQLCLFTHFSCAGCIVGSPGCSGTRN